VPEHRIDLGQRAHLLQDGFLPGDHVVFQVRFLERVQAAHELGQAVGILLVELGVEQLERVREVLEGLDRIAQLVQVGDFQLELRRRGRNSCIGGSSRRTVTGSLHRLEDALEVRALYRQQAVERRLAVLDRFREDHFLHDRQAIGAVEHALGAHQAYSGGAELARAGRVLRRVGIGHHLQPRRLVGPGEQHDHFPGKRRLHGRHFSRVDMAGAAIDGDDVAFVQRWFRR